MNQFSQFLDNTIYELAQARNEKELISQMQQVIAHLQFSNPAILQKKNKKGYTLQQSFRSTLKMLDDGRLVVNRTFWSWIGSQFELSESDVLTVIRANLSAWPGFEKYLPQ